MNPDDFPKVDIQPYYRIDEETGETVFKITIGYTSVPSWTDELDLYDIDHIFLLRDAIDAFISKYNIKRHNDEKDSKR